MRIVAAGAGSGGGAGERKRGVRATSDRITSAMKAEGCCLLLALLTLALFGGDGASALEVLLHAPNYVFVGESAVLKCEHGVSTPHLHKVEWLKDGDHKLFQFVRGRNPPFRNFTTPGATLDWSRSNEHEIHLTSLSLEASGIYSCEVSMETPIYTKPSNDEKLVVIQRQLEDPVISGMKASYFSGEKVAVNCTSSPTHPAVQITWLVNGHQVTTEELLTRFPEGSVRQYELTTHGAHHIRPFRTSSEDNFEDMDNSRTWSRGESSTDASANALGAKSGLNERAGKKNDLLATATLGKLLHVSTTLPPTPRGGHGGPTVSAPTRAASSSVPGGRAFTAAPGATVTTWTQQDEDEDDSNPMDAFEPPEVVPVMTATASSTTVQLSFVLTDEVVRCLKKDSEESGNLDPKLTAPKVRLILTCSAIITETVNGGFADHRLTTIAADVILSEETTARLSSTGHSSQAPPRPWLLFLPLFASLFLLAATTPTALMPHLHQQQTTPIFSALTDSGHGIALPNIFELPCIVNSVNHVRPRR